MRLRLPRTLPNIGRMPFAQSRPAFPAGNVLFAYRGLDEISPNFARPSLIEIEERAARVQDSIYGVGVGSLTLVHRGIRTESWYRNDNRTQQHYFHWPSYQRRFAIGPRLGWGDLAGLLIWARSSLPRSLGIVPAILRQLNPLLKTGSLAYCRTLRCFMPWYQLRKVTRPEKQ